MARYGGPISRGRVRVVPGDVLTQREGSSGDKSAWVGVRKRGLNGTAYYLIRAKSGLPPLPRSRDPLADTGGQHTPGSVRDMRRERIN